MKKRGVSFYILIVLALLAVGALAFALAPGRQMSTPAVVLPTPPPAEVSAPVAQEHASAAEVIAVTPETVQTVIGTLRRVDSYSRTLTVRDFWSGGSRSRAIAVWCRGDSLRLRISDGINAEQELLIRGADQWLWFSDSDAVYHGAALPDDADQWQTMLTYERVLDAPMEDILDARYTDLSGTDCIYVRWRAGSLGYVSECYIDPGTGLLMGERCYDGEKLIYSMDSSVPDITTPGESVFVLPDGARA